MNKVNRDFGATADFLGKWREIWTYRICLLSNNESNQVILPIPAEQVIFGPWRSLMID